ncbi:Chromo domain protein [Ophiocordyceps sinensis CO18]|uniref:Chromo domain protein n=1 Tax=Ophiocordyceps sinensis (strain Co18 / CGMCC 3.14243) TaxID=911162 RepID=T5A8V9_OPHSC|nr:Chromo domain protein [Ophiocordyceps sinensis CO18]
MDVFQLRPRKNKPTSRIEIALRSKPRDYVPGSGPPLQRVCLLPPQDSTAYIVERILLPSPGPAADGKPLPKRMTYVIGWRDLPAARDLVPAMKILDYVSPRALEEWEFNMETELDEDRKMLAHEMHTGGDKKGRPPAHTGIESAAVAELDSGTPTRMKMGAMSLSTPRKTRPEDFDGLSDDDSGSPSMQIAREARWYLSDEVDLVDDSKQSGLEPEWGSRGLGAIGGNGTSQEAHDLASAPTSRPAPRPFGLSGTQTEGFTPFNGVSRQQPTSKATKRSLEPTHTTHSSKKTPIKRPKPRKKSDMSAKWTPAARPVLDNDGEPAWVVKRLEDMAVYDVEGRGLVRYFQVRWEGDWPPDQNPTWEPEENIPSNIVRNFLKRGKKRKRASTGRASTGRTPRAIKTSLGAGIHYKSVSEAFAGEVADDTLEPNRGENTADNDDARDARVTAGFIQDSDNESELFVI